MNKEFESRTQMVRDCLLRCALEVDPGRGWKKVLAAEIDVHPITLHVWERNGRIPPKAAKRLQKRFGKKLADASLLSDNG